MSEITYYEFVMAQLPVNVSHWRNFLRVADHGSFSKVAELHNIAQPAISRQMRSLEDTLGTELFNRSVQGVSLTEAGRLFQERASGILQQLEKLRDDISKVSVEPSGNLTIGVAVSLAPLLTVSFVKFMRETMPRVRPNILVGTTTQIADALLSRRCEVGVLLAPVNEEIFSVVPLARDPLMLIGSLDSKLTPRKPLRPHDLSELPLIFLGRDSVIYHRIEGAFVAAGLKLNTTLEIDSTSIMHLAESGIGFAPMPSAVLADRGFRRRTKHCQIAGLSVEWCLCHLRSEPLSVAAKRAMEWVQSRIVSGAEDGRWRAEIIAPQT